MTRNRFVALAWVLLGIACGGSGPTGGPPSPPPPPPPPPSGNAVDVQNGTFNPQSRTINVGATVTWTWRSSQHNVTFEDGQGNSATLNTGATHQRTFSAAGTYRYRCTIHSSNFTSGMSGQVVAQ